MASLIREPPVALWLVENNRNIVCSAPCSGTRTFSEFPQVATRKTQLYTKSNISKNKTKKRKKKKITLIHTFTVPAVCEDVRVLCLPKFIHKTRLLSPIVFAFTRKMLDQSHSIFFSIFTTRDHKALKVMVRISLVSRCF